MSVLTVLTVSTTPARMAAAAVTLESFPPERSATGLPSHHAAVLKESTMPSPPSASDGTPSSMMERIHSSRSHCELVVPSAPAWTEVLAGICPPLPRCAVPCEGHPSVAMSFQVDCDSAG
ncbi:hypothetical protein DS079_09605 [Brachybacterium paraconglomeratum]|uniref:Uncharacterized protein n=1 Tax=Brachybacterium paraconglomeratum TaxID=173362 RepID=A0A426SJR9_9MICO|nr:hypothetical protein DS079_09605 [Brachybacterium paraconglomeratum]